MEVQYGNFNNAYYKMDINYVVRPCRVPLRILAAWPPDHTRRCAILGHLICLFFMVAFVVPMMMQLFFEKNDFNTFIINLGISNTFLFGLIKYIIFVRQIKRLNVFLEQIAADWKDVTAQDREIMLKYAKLSRFFSLTATNIMNIAWFGWNVLAHSESPTVVDNRTFHTFTYPTYFPNIDPRETPLYYYYVVIQTVGSFMSLTVLTSTASIGACVILHICGRFNILSKDVWSLGSDDRRGSNNNDIKLMVKRHDHLFRFSEEVDEVFDALFFTEWIDCVNGVCFCALLFITEERGYTGVFNDFTAAFVLSYLFFIFCYAGDELKQQSEYVGDAFYFSKWYAMSNSKARDCLMILRNSQTPRKLTAGKIVYLCMNTYGDVMKRAFALVSLLKSMA